MATPDFLELLGATTRRRCCTRCAPRIPSTSCPARLLARDAPRRREAALQRSRERHAGPPRLGALRARARGHDAALGRGPQLFSLARRGARALPPAGSSARSRRARCAAWTRRSARWSSASRRRCAGGRGEVIDLLGEFTEPDAEHRDQPDHRRAARRRRGALPRARAGHDPRLLAVHAAGGAARGAERASRSSPLGARDGGGAARARRARTRSRIWCARRTRDERAMRGRDRACSSRGLIGAGSETTALGGAGRRSGRCSRIPQRWSACAATAR